MNTIEFVRNPLLQHRRGRAKSRWESFTLVELLVAVTILSVMLVGFASMMSFVVQTWLAGVNVANNFTKARTMLSLMDRDVQMMVMRSDLGAFTDGTGTNPNCAFYTKIEGYPGADTRSLSLVQYSLVQSTTSSVLQRLNYGMNFTTGGMTPSVGYSTNLVQLGSANLTGATPDNISNGVIAFQWQFIDGSGTILTPPYSLTSTPYYWQSATAPYQLSSAPPNTYLSPPPSDTTPFWFDYVFPGASYNPRTLVVSLVVISDNAYSLALKTGTLQSLITQFPTTISNLTSTTVNGNSYVTETYAQYWNGLLNPPSGTFAPTLPAPLRAPGSIQVYERHIPLPMTTPSTPVY